MVFKGAKLFEDSMFFEIDAATGEETGSGNVRREGVTSDKSIGRGSATEGVSVREGVLWGEVTLGETSGILVGEGEVVLVCIETEAAVEMERAVEANGGGGDIAEEVGKDGSAWDEGKEDGVIGICG